MPGKKTQGAYRMGAPLPLSKNAALQQALYLRTVKGLTFPAIAVLMGEYHGWYYSETWWRWHLLRMGAPKTPKGPGAFGAPNGNRTYQESVR